MVSHQQIMLPFKLSVAKAIVLALLVPTSLAAPFDKREKKVLALSFDVVQEQVGNSTSNLVARLQERDESIVNPLEGTVNSYLIDLLIGSNKDQVKVALDTGSSDLNVPAKGVTCETSGCADNGVYDAGSSSTAQDLGIPVHLTYGKGASTGEFYKDDVSLADNSNVVVKALQFVDTTQSQGASGILGIGYDSGESTASKYPNFVSSLKDQGYINKKAYSLYLDAAGTNKGTIIFGGKDTKKYQGSLVTYPTYNNDRLSIALQLVSHGSTSENFGGSQAVLDSGTTFTILIASNFYELANKNQWQDISLELNSPAGTYYAGSCKGDDFVFDFGNGGKVTVPYSDATLRATNDPNVDLCLITFLPNRLDESIQNLNILGDNFLRSAYVVYDLDDHKISIGQVQHTSDSNVVEL